MSAAPSILNPQHPPARLALAYTRVADRPLWSAYFALEARLSETGTRTSQPIMAQVRLAWWRDRLKSPAQDWPQGEPLLAALAPWDAERHALVALVDGWEALLVGEDGGAELAQARIGVMLALARLLVIDDPDAIERAAREWQFPELATGRGARLRSMRPLLVLRALALREAGKGGGIIGILRAALAAK